MSDNFCSESHTNLILIKFDDQQKANIGAALKKVADQMVPSLNKQLSGNEGESGPYVKTENQNDIEIGMAFELKKEQEDENLAIENSFPSLTRNKEEIVGITEISNSLNEPYSCQTLNNLSTHITMTKEEPQLQEFKIEPSELDESLSADEANVKSVKKFSHQPNSNQAKLATTNDGFEIEVLATSDDSEGNEVKSGNTQHLSTVYICPECGIECGPYLMWKSHTEKEHQINWRDFTFVKREGELFYQCPDCNKQLSRSKPLRHLQEHKITHMPHKYYLKCCFCDKRFQSESVVYNHIRRKHSKVARPYIKNKPSDDYLKYINIFCPFCQQWQPNIERWEQHLTEKHDFANKIQLQSTRLDKYNYSCNLCQRILSRKIQIKKHMLLHEPNKSFQCILCKKFDTNLKNSLYHIKSKH